MRNFSLKAGALLLLAGLAACGGGGASVPNDTSFALPAQSGPSTSAIVQQGAPAVIDRSAAATVSQSVVAASATTLAINAGGGSTGSWIADADYNGGQVVTVSNSINTSHVSNPAPQSVYQSQRWTSNLIYTVPNLAPGTTYTVRLHFVESYWNAARKRLFNVKINGSQVLTNFDIFQNAGGANIAIAQAFSTSADATGKITIQLIASVDNASIAAIEISGASASAAPSPAPTSSSGDVLPWVFSELWSSSSPFKSTVSHLKSAGATTVSHTYMDRLWNQGLAGNATAGGIPIYVAKSSDPLLTIVCTMYGGNCNAKNLRVHVPTNATTQQTSDGHLVVIDENAPSGAIEVDCWQAATSGSSFKCSWGGAYALGSSGVSENGSEGIHGGMAISSVFITGKEIANGHIDHALGMNTRCLNNASIYPADTLNGTDSSCDGSSSPPHYGNMVHLLWSSSQIASSGYSAPCKVVLTALATYGAYLNDTGNDGLELDTESDAPYKANSSTAALDPWPQIQSQLNASGDGTYSTWASCLNRLQSNDLELVQIAQP